jgi:hypothetical protein
MKVKKSRKARIYDLVIKTLQTKSGFVQLTSQEIHNLIEKLYRIK